LHIYFGVNRWISRFYLSHGFDVLRCVCGLVRAPI
jgi:hypothetical protein